MICIVCHHHMERMYERVETAPGFFEHVLAGYKCVPCSEKMHREVIPDIPTTSTEEFREHLEWIKQYNRVCSEYANNPLPEGFAFP